jgi:hypothetical protein
MPGSIEIWCLVAFSLVCIASGIGMLIQRVQRENDSLRKRIGSPKKILDAAEVTDIGR